MCEYNKIIEIIYSYYPPKYSFLSSEYQNSNEYEKYTERIFDFTLRKSKEGILQKILKDVFPNCYLYKSRNEEYPSVNYSVLLHENQNIMDDDDELLNELGGERFNLQIYVSLLGDYCYYYIEKTKKLSSRKHDLFFSAIKEFNLFDKTFEKLEISLKNNNIKLLDSELVHKNVPQIETELVSKGDVMIFHCLFRDIVDDF